MILFKKKRSEIIQYIMTAVEYIIEEDLNDDSVLDAILDNLEAAMYLVDEKAAQQEIEGYSFEALIRELRDQRSSDRTESILAFLDE